MNARTASLVSATGQSFFLWLVVYLFTCLACKMSVDASEPANSLIQFNRHIRPVLTDLCLPCHGFDAGNRKANLRLDTPEGATAVLKGRQAVKPGEPDASELMRRITSTDPAVVMPPPGTQKKIKPEEIARIRQWIREGATYQKHWAFEAPVRPEVPPESQAGWGRNEIDRFVAAALGSRKLRSAPEASKETLIRRASLDLTGLPPTLAEVEQFVVDSQPDSYERLVDRLLDSPRYGEHMARYWLDVARYGDTHGLHLDNERSMWAYRDWVVEAFNQNLPFDRFTIWQLAGDLLPNPTRSQLVASGFNRCNVSTSEGGAIDEEFLVRYAVDRVETASTAWLGLTMGCAVCHDHKLDPITQKEFYQVFSIFNNLAEKAMDGNALLPPPILPLPSEEQEKKMADLDAQIARLEGKIREIVTKVDYLDPATLTNVPKSEPEEVVWVDDDFPAKADVSVNAGNEPHQWVNRENGQVHSGEKAILRSGKGLHQVYFSKCEAPLTISPGDRLFAYVFIDEKDPPKAIMLQYHTEDWLNRANWGDADAIGFGKKDTPEKVQIGALPKAGKWVRLEVPAAKLGLAPGTRLSGMAFTHFDGKAYWDKAGLLAVNDPAQSPQFSQIAWAKYEKNRGDQSSEPEEIRKLLKKNADELTQEDREKLRKHYLQAVYSDPQFGLPPCARS